MTRFAPPGRVITASSSAMAHLGMSDDEMTTFIKDGFGVDSSFSAKDLFEAAELPSWLSVRTDLGLSKSAGLQLQNVLLKAIEARAAPGTANARPPRRRRHCQRTAWAGRWFMEAASSMACAAIPAAHRGPHSYYA